MRATPRGTSAGSSAATGAGATTGTDAAAATADATAGSRTRAGLLFAVASLCFGTGFVGIKAGLDVVPPVLFAALRFDVGAAILLAAVAIRARRRGREWRPRRRRDLLAVLVAGTFLTWLNGLALFVGQQFTTTAAAAVVYAVVPVATPLFALALLRDADERLSRLGAVGLVVGFIGVAVVVRPDPTTLLAGDARGQLIVLAGALSVAFGSVLLRRVDPALDSLALTAWAMAVAAVANHATSVALGEPSAAALAWTPAAVLAVAYVGVVSTAIAFPAYFGLLASAGAVRANLTAYVVPVVAAVAGVVVLGESVAPTTVAGFLVVAAGFALLEFEALSTTVRRVLRGGTAGTGVTATTATDVGGTDRSDADADADAERDRDLECWPMPDGGVDRPDRRSLPDERADAVDSNRE